MAQQTEQRAVINGRNYVGFVIPGQFITIYRADEEFKPITDGLEGVWTFRSETLKLGTNPTLNEGEIRHHFVNRLGDAEMNQAPPSATNSARDHAESAVPRFYDSCHVYCQPCSGCVDAVRWRVTPRRCSSARAVDGWHGVRQCDRLGAFRHFRPIYMVAGEMTRRKDESFRSAVSQSCEVDP